MDMDGMTMPMATSTSSAAMSSATGMKMGGMSMGGSCKISMLWNWYTVDACFLARSWHITSRGMFAGSCIGVICLVLSLEFLRRLGREYDSFIVRRARLRRLYMSSTTQSISNVPLRSEDTTTAGNCCNAPDSTFNTDDDITPAGPHNGGKQSTASANAVRDGVKEGMLAPYRPSLVEHTVRSLMHMAQFAVAYIIMLLAMYFNGYIIICIFIGAFLGAFIFSWEAVDLNKE
ncbi:Ctr copper transporter [Penicillium cf. griseofulvum]|uniref:Copper transport protein n=1 Tax=Penicillium cf. griseofulvum TaxID=2972120 RepID=A0A9W9M0V4_9EURO|nr:Ctr copper transporter [Penicillium cf. griseofulvum]KAJ5430156.1 Ctr copper transporter [Penicillium cf. griseofulvum]KAJ5436073.1 Ctr copper transporter [Penicillium cf. griseofulvum]